MRSHLALAFIAVSVIAYCQSAEVGIRSYSGYQVLRASATSEEQYAALEKFSREVDASGIDFWTEPSFKGFTDIMAPPQQLQEVQDFLTSHGIKYEVHIPDLEKIISEQRDERLRTTSAEPKMNWQQYQTLATINTWLRELAANYSTVTIEEIGRSTENRELYVLKIAKNDGVRRPAFFIDATIHAREWISTATISYIINELVTNSGQYEQLLNAIDFYFLPIINPDGYSYTFTNDRLWRKTRSNHNSPLGCRGVDANRNFGYQFGGPGSSSDKCSETYRGPSAYSEPEAEATKNYILAQRANNVDFQAYITLHSYSQLWMTPWGYTKNLPSDYAELKRVGDLAAAALASLYGTQYEVGSAANILYESSGSSRDWAKGEGGFKYVYTIELRDTGRYGFVLPPEQILPTARETWAGIQVVARNLLTTQ